MIASADGSHGLRKHGREILISGIMREVSLSGESALEEDAPRCADTP